MNKKIIIVLATLCCVILALAVAPVEAHAAELSISSKEAILMSEDGQILFEKNANEKRPIASMTKIMTLLCVYDAVESSEISLADKVVVSNRSASMGGSQVFLEENGVYTVENLVKSVIVCSANDSCVALAEYIAGSVENFVESMNAKADALGLAATHFENCTGLPHISQFSCAKDVAVMLRELIKHPHYFTCARIWIENFVHPDGRVTEMTNTNRLIRFYDGCDGGKTGFTNEAQHCLAATAKRGDTRVISVVVGAPDSKTRFAEVSGMFNYAFANYRNKIYLDANSKLESVEVDGGKSSFVEMVAAGKLFAFGKKDNNQYSVKVESVQSVKAPVAVGQKLGVAKLIDPNGDVVGEVELVAKCDVEAKSYWDYIKEIASGK